MEQPGGSFSSAPSSDFIAMDHISLKLNDAPSASPSISCKNCGNLCLVISNNFCDRFFPASVSKTDFKSLSAPPSP